MLSIWTTLRFCFLVKSYRVKKTLLFQHFSFFRLFQFKINGDWWTWIDYPKFHQLVQDFKTSDGHKTFTAQDYMAKTPHWAVFGAEEQGFDPNETRYFRKTKKDIGGC